MKKIPIILTSIFSLFFLLSCGGTDDPEIIVNDEDIIIDNNCDTPGTQICSQDNIYVCSDDNTLVLNTDCVSNDLICQEIDGSFACVEPDPVCGNGTKEAGELCDSNSVDCSDLGNYTSGTDAICKTDCSGYDTTSCTAPEPNTVCGNGTKESGESCDSDSVDCSTLGNYNSGTNAVCKTDCSGYDTSSCTAPEPNPVCGNGTKESGESCDSDSVDCSTLGNYTSGTNAACKTDCSGYDSSVCENVTPQTCGNGTLDSGEVCDGTTVDCATIGNYETGNSSTCNSDCLGRNVLKCIPKLSPSNGLIMTIEGTINDIETISSSDDIVRPTTLSASFTKDSYSETLNDSAYSWIGIYDIDTDKYFKVHTEGAFDSDTSSYYTSDFLTFQNNIDVMNTNGETSLEQSYYVVLVNYIKMNSTTSPTYQISCQIFTNDKLETSELYIDPAASTMTAGSTFKMKMNSSLTSVTPTTDVCSCWDYDSSTGDFGDQRDCTATEISAF